MVRASTSTRTFSRRGFVVDLATTSLLSDRLHALNPRSSRTHPTSTPRLEKTTNPQPKPEQTTILQVAHIKLEEQTRCLEEELLCNTTLSVSVWGCRPYNAIFICGCHWRSPYVKLVYTARSYYYYYYYYYTLHRHTSQEGYSEGRVLTRGKRSK